MRAGTLLIGSAIYGARRCVVCGRPAEKYDVDAGPWCSDLCQMLGACRWCGLPPSDAEGHWCTTDTGTVWRRWDQ